MTLLRGYFSPQLLRSGICSWDVLEILNFCSTFRLLVAILLSAWEDSSFLIILSPKRFHHPTVRSMRCQSPSTQDLGYYPC